MLENWQNLGSAIDNSFFFVLDKLIRIEGYFIDVAFDVARGVLLIAILTACLKQLLTGEGLKQGLIQTMKAFVFFWIIVAAYPRVVSWITTYAYDLAYGSTGASVSTYFTAKVQKMERIVSEIDATGTTYHSLSVQFYRQKDLEIQALFSKMTKETPVIVDRDKGTVTYTAVVPSVAVQVMLVIAYDAFSFADNSKIVVGSWSFPDFANILKGLICGFFIILTGIFALLEYIMCLLEFFLVTSIGVILLPLSIWEGSKFATEGYIKAIIGFFFKLLLCTMSIFLLLYGFISMFHMLEGQGFSGSPDQLTFIIFTCLLFFYICKSAPGIAQSLITGSPSLSATGAISAAGGAVAAAAAVGGLAQKAGQAGVGVAEAGTKAVATGNSVMQNGGNFGDALAAGAGSLAKDAGSAVLNGALGLKRKDSDGSLGERFSRSIDEGNQRGQDYMSSKNLGSGMVTPEPIPQQQTQQPQSPASTGGEASSSSGGIGGGSQAPAAPTGNSESKAGASGGGGSSGGASGGGASGGGGSGGE